MVNRQPLHGVQAVTGDTSDKPKVSVIMAFLDPQRYIKEAIESVVAIQPFRNYSE